MGRWVTTNPPGGGRATHSQAQAAARCIQRAVRCYAARQQGRRLRRLRDQRLAERLMEQPVGQAVDLPPGVCLLGAEWGTPATQPPYHLGNGESMFDCPEAANFNAPEICLPVDLHKAKFQEQ